MRALLTLAMTAGLVAGCGMPAPNQNQIGPTRLQTTAPQTNFNTKYWVRPFGRYWGGFYRPWIGALWPYAGIGGLLPYAGIGAFGLPISSVYLFSPYRAFYNPFFYRGFWGPRFGARWW